MLEILSDEILKVHKVMGNKITNTCVPNTWLYEMLTSCLIYFRHVSNNETFQGQMKPYVFTLSTHSSLSLSPQVYHYPEFAKMLYLPELYILYII